MAGALVVVLIALHTLVFAAGEGEIFIDNGKIRLGVDLESGGSVFYLSESAPRRNLLNRFDRGRFIQQSYYGDSDGSRWGKREWRWNPVQGGDYKGLAAGLIEHASTDETLYTKSTPKHWATGADIDEAVMEQWIALMWDVVHIRVKFSYVGDSDHQPRHQEMPAVFADYDLANLMFYRGQTPWTNGELTSKVPQWPNEYEGRDEHWAAYFDDGRWGIGVYTAGTREMTCYRYRGTKGPDGSGCSYFAPIKTLAITSETEIEYEVYLTIGQVADIRSRFYQIHSASQPE